MMNFYWRIGTYLLTVLFGLSVGWTSEHWRATAQIDTLKTTDAEQAAKDTARALALQTERYAAQAAEATRLASIDKAELEKLKGAQDENNRLRSCLADGSCGLRVHATCLPHAGRVSASAPRGGVAAGPACRLDASAQRDYLSLRDGLSNQLATLRACQAALKTLTGQK